MEQVFVSDVAFVAKSLGLREAEAGANVVLTEPFDDVVFARTMVREGLNCAALPQVVVDLLTRPGRAPQDAEELLAWMAKNEKLWRA